MLVHNVATIALKAAFLFFDVADLTNFKAADLTRFEDVRFFATVRFPVIVRFFAAFFTVVLRFADRFPDDFLSAILLKFKKLFIKFIQNTDDAPAKFPVHYKYSVEHKPCEETVSHGQRSVRPFGKETDNCHCHQKVQNEPTAVVAPKETPIPCYGRVKIVCVAGLNVVQDVDERTQKHKNEGG